jgi:hypothetical protein
MNFTCKRFSRRYLSLPKRDLLGLTGLEMNKLNVLRKNATLVTRLYCELRRRDKVKFNRLRTKLRRLLISIVAEMLIVTRVEIPSTIERAKGKRRHRRLSIFGDLNGGEF